MNKLKEDLDSIESKKHRNNPLPYAGAFGVSTVDNFKLGGQDDITALTE